MPDKPVFRPGIMLENLHQKSPLIHNITNYVTANDCANILLACGASPIMADDPLEAADIILMEDEPSRIINAIRIAKATLRSVSQNMVFAIGMKVILIVLAFLGLVTMQNAILADMAVMLINILNSFWMLKYPE